MIEDQTSSLEALTQWAAYIYTAMAHARYERIDDGQTVYAEIPGFAGLWATGPTFAECRAELLSALEDWIDEFLDSGLPLPQLPGVAGPVAA